MTARPLGARSSVAVLAVLAAVLVVAGVVVVRSATATEVVTGSLLVTGGTSVGGSELAQAESVPDEPEPAPEDFLPAGITLLAAGGAAGGLLAGAVFASRTSARTTR